MSSQLNLKGLDLGELQTFVESIGEKRFRAQQLFGWIYGRNVDSFEAMTNLSKPLRSKLESCARVGRLNLVEQSQSAKDGSCKMLFQMDDAAQVETVLMTEGDRTTLCVSTQVGCAIDCKFCATGTMGLKRNLTAGEIVDQFLAAQQKSSGPITNLVLMGMGEPFHNYDNVLKACALVCHEDGPNFGQKNIVISTSGLIPQIRQFTDEGQKYRLAISLNATTDEVRERLMPLNKKWPIRELLKAARYYTEQSGEVVTFEYVLLAGVNDSVEDASRLRRLVRGLRCKINLIPYNSAVREFSRPLEKRILRFYQMLADLPVPITIRWSKGDDIAAGCGQLATSDKGVYSPAPVQ